MSISNTEEIKCSCGETFEAELLSAISVFDNPELKESMLCGEINIVQCPHCEAIFYAERFVLYHDSQDELLAFVYPLKFQEQAALYRVQMLQQFNSSLNSLEDKEQVCYEPLLIFGIEDLTSLIKAEQDLKDEEKILKYASKELKLNTFSISRALSRKLSIPRIIPIAPHYCGQVLQSSDLCVQDRQSPYYSGKNILEALKTLTAYNPNLSNYVQFISKAAKHNSILEEILRHCKISNCNCV
ncbi:MAG: CpXC domain-containing protein [Elusimicrobiota bacterium]|jgi:hypothetical protein|nr:CpXC domain-containing protein [Elusimicrobiota bacterium]